MRTNPQWHRILWIIRHITVEEVFMIFWWSAVMIVVGIAYGFVLGIIPVFLVKCIHPGNQQVLVALMLSLLVGCVVTTAWMQLKTKKIYKLVVFTITIGFGLIHFWVMSSWLYGLLTSFGFAVGYALRFYQFKQTRR